jgi:thioredoxin 1
VVQNITDQDFKKEVTESSGYVLIDFWAPWCGPCKQLGPVLDEVSKITKEVKFLKINIDDNPEVASELGIRSIPTLILFKDGEKLDTRLGAMSATALQAWIKEKIAN